MQKNINCYVPVQHILTTKLDNTYLMMFFIIDKNDFVLGCLFLEQSKY